MSEQQTTPGAAPVMPEEKKNPLHTPGLTSLLKPEMPRGMQVAFSNKQNFALAAEQIFVHALNRTVWVYRDTYAAVDIMLKQVCNVAMESLGTQQGIDYVTNMVFYNQDAVLREFLFTLQVQFFSQFGEFQAFWTELISNIAESLTCAVTGGKDVKKDLCLVPAELTERMFTPENMRDLLLANNWLIMFIFIALWGRTYTYDELRAFNRRVNAAAHG
ncbi:hypothetical protein [Ralstonia phage RP12]|uniref:Uncharacterized protein n=1 Tax=Ralstonia phage RP12 TaxID=1923889 RepID=A0A1L7N0N8_9CAUD|nr:hypothetical protein FDH28_gp053 [Ralstonia phage RP12]BAW19027.1 hypothetical protein [Ralstonia phage RP12]